MTKTWAVILGVLALLLSALPAVRPSQEGDPLLTVTVDGKDYRLGESTAEDFALNGWEYAVESDGTYSFYSPENGSYFYVCTATGAPDAPAVSIDLMWADGIPAVYQGFAADAENDGSERTLWDWLAENFPAETNEDGALIAAVSLPTGDVLQIATTGQRVRLTLTQADE